jgi:bifunctional UDP-N-acetylglucosamine pyrophosphorylase / glucosamine-1-phosphate N-acetyltransferase
VTAPTVVVLAAGHGTRMRSRTPKVLHDLCGRPMVGWPVAAAREAGAARVVVVGGPDRALDGRLPDGVELAVQPEANGTGGAVQAAAAHLGDGPVVVVNGDVPLLTAAVLGELVAAHEAGGAQATILTTRPEDPTGLGRVVRGPGGAVERIVETKVASDATADELALREVNAGVYAFDGAALRIALERLRPDNAQGELYLTDTIALLDTVAAHAVDDATVLLGVNDRVELARARALAQRRILEAHMRAGVTVVDPAATLVEVDVEIGADTTLEPSIFLRGRTRVGEGCRIGPLTTIVDSTLGDGVTVLNAVIVGSELHDGALVGPFAYLRPGTVMRAGSKAGTYVELKNSDVGERTKIPHLSYVGDADVGPDTNLGAATITANYDGRRKHRTTIGARVRSSVDVSFVAPVTVGDDAWTGAGSVITDDVPPGALGVARERQTNVEGYDARRRARDEGAPS